MPETKPSEHIPALFEPLHFQKTALAKIENARLREVLGETIDSITATLASNFWMLVAQKLAPSAQDAVSMQIHLSENFGSNNIFASGMSLADILFHAQNAETTNHLRNQIVVGLCCNLENSISQLSDYLGNPKPLKNYGVSSKPVLKWAGIGEFYKLKTAEISHGFSEENLRLLQSVFTARNRIVHHNSSWTEVLGNYPTFWRKSKQIETSQDKIDAIVQWIDNKLLRGWLDLDVAIRGPLPTG